MENNCRGFAPVIILYFVGALALTQLVPNLRLSHFFQKGPGTKQLAEAQAKLEQLKIESDAAVVKLRAAQEEALAKQREQVGYSQQMELGAIAALKRAEQSPEVILASGFLDRASTGLRAAIGDLPVSRQAEIMAIVEGALSAKQAEIDQAKAALAQRDKDLAIETAERKAVEAQIPKLTEAVAIKSNEVAAAQSVVTTKTAQVVAYADKAAAQEKEAGSLGALVTKLAWGLGILALLYIVANWVLPSLAQEFPNAARLQAVNKTVKSVTSAHL